MTAGFSMLVAVLAAQAPTATSTAAAAKAAFEATARGDPVAARRALEGWPGGALADYRALLLGQVALLEGDPKAAEARFSEISELPKEALKCKPACKHPLWELAQEGLAEAKAKSAPKAAAQHLAGLPSTGARLVKAAALERAAGREAEAQALERRLLLDAPESPEGRALAEGLGPSGLEQRLLDLPTRLVRVRKLLEVHENDLARSEARLLLQRVGKRDPAMSCELSYIEGKASRKLREYRAALAALIRAFPLCQEAKDSSRAQASSLLEVQVRSIAGDLLGAEKATRRMIAADSTHRFADDALLLLAQLQERRGKAPQARSTYREILERYPTGDQAQESAWWLAFEAIRRGAKDEAQAALAIAERSTAQDPVDRARVLYWQARLFEGGDQCPRYVRAAMEPGLTFYSWLAHAEATRRAPACSKALERALLDRVKSKGATPRPRPPFLASAVWTRGKELGALGQAELAARELALLEAEVTDLGGAVALGLAYHQVGAHEQAQAILRWRAADALKAPPDEETLPVFEAAYSRPFQEELESAAKASRVEPLLLTALVREESTFDPAIVSWAGAIGLAQLMPATAIGAHADLGLGRLELTRLVEPALNLRLGAHVLRVGLRQFDQAVPLALAAYNGGAGLVKKALPSGGDQPFDLWVESVPVRETRRYVQRVCGTWGIYRFLYDAKSPFIALPEVVRTRY